MIDTNHVGGDQPFNDFFDRLASFDTETTGINTKKDRIWQAGFTKKGIDAEEVVNPFFRFDEIKKSFEPEELSIIDFHERMVEGNGAFSRTAHANNNFSELFSQHHVHQNLSSSLSDTLDKTLGNLSRGDVLVLQNHNFENRLIQKGYDDGLINKTTYQRLQDKMEFLNVDPESGKTLGLLQVPTEVSILSQRASFIKEVEMTRDPSNKVRRFKSYTNTLNNLVDAYKRAIQRPDRGAVVVEQMDITKALYANAIDQGYMNRAHANIGLKMDFLTDVLFDGRVEAHTALSDSKDTIDVFKKTWGMIEELRTGNVSDETKQLLVKINDKQRGVAHTQFMTSVESVLEDFKRDGYTRYSPSGSLYVPQRGIYDASSGDILKIKGESVGRNNANKGVVSALDTALDNVLSRYAEQPNEQFREDYVNKLKSTYSSEGLDKTSLLASDMKANFRLEDLPVTRSVSTEASWWNNKTTLFGKEVSKGTKGSLIVGGLLTLGYMAMKDSPEKRDENSYVAQQFYDEQYLGTQFVNFNERNKHYMY